MAKENTDRSLQGKQGHPMTLATGIELSDPWRTKTTPSRRSEYSRLQASDGSGTDNEEYEDDDVSESEECDLRKCRWSWKAMTLGLFGPPDRHRAYLEPRQAILTPSEDIYDCVSVAAFGGIVMGLGQNQHGKEMMEHVHPVFLWIFAMLLFSIQGMFLIAVILEVDQVGFFASFDVTHVHIWQFESETKLALITIVQIMVNEELRQSVEMFTYLISLPTWSWRWVPFLGGGESVGPTSIEGEASVFTNRLVLVPLVVTASSAKLIIAYYTSVSSISIIYQAQSLTEAIFNSLALTFIKDLDEAVWTLLCSNFRLKFVNLLQCWRFCSVRRSSGFEGDGSVQDGYRGGEGFTCGGDEFRFLLPPLTVEMRAFPFRLLHKGVVRRLIVCIFLFILYQQMMFMSIDVMRCGWLPSSRQVCWLWKSMLGKDDVGWSGGVLGSFLHTVMGGAESRLMKMADPAEGGYCTGVPEQEFISWKTKANILSKYPLSVIAGATILAVLVILPPGVQTMLEELCERRQAGLSRRRTDSAS